MILMNTCNSVPYALFFIPYALLCDGINKDDVIYYDRHAGHKIELDRETYHVIKAQDVVFVL